MRRPGRLRTIPAMIRDKSAKTSAKKPAKDAPKQDAARKAAPSKGAKAPAMKVPAGRKGIIALAPPSFRRERALIKRGVWPV
ncbi:ribonuclease HII, partial [Bradyrhizobium sp. PRIMUS42]|nr:ribonuclease HII [Bradyrhizobium sp. PRIMUS42]